MASPVPRPAAAAGRAGRELADEGARCAGMELTCPKCHGTMRTYERNGVHVDQCADCRGIFLDRGELDRLIDAENAWHGGGERTSTPERTEHRTEHRAEYPQSGHQQTAGLGGVVGEVLRQVQGAKHSPHSSSGYPHRKKKDSFLGDLFG